MEGLRLEDALPSRNGLRVVVASARCPFCRRAKHTGGGAVSASDTEKLTPLIRWGG